MVIDRTRVLKILETTTEHRWRFFALFLLVFFITLSILTLVGFVPESEQAEVTFSERSGEPVRISIPRVGVDVHIENPESTDILLLDNALTRGAVHYPGSGNLTENTNVFLFGHSSFLPVVINKNFQAFNGLRNVVSGDDIYVYSTTHKYHYRASSVRLSEAENITVHFEKGEKKLTLSTCNSFGDASERYIVEAKFVGSRVLER